MLQDKGVMQHRDATEGTTAAPPLRFGRAGRWVRALARAVIGAGALWAAAVAGLAILASLGPRPVALPLWMLAEIEARLTRALTDRGNAGLSVALGGVTADAAGGVPRLVLTDLRLVGPEGAALVRLPAVAARFDAAALARRQLRLTDIAAPGARIRLILDADGRLDVAFGDDAAAFDPAALAQGLNRLLAQPELQAAERLAATGAIVTVDDRRAGRVWRAEDGTIDLTRGGDGALRIAAGFVLAGEAAAARLDIALAPDGATRLAARVERLPAVTAAALSPAAAMLAMVDAPLSATVDAAVGADGAIAAFGGTLTAGAGVLRPGPGAEAIAFDGAAVRFAFDPAAARIVVHEASIRSDLLRLTATGTLAATGAPVPSVIGQFRLGAVTLDPEGRFVAPLRFDGGAADLRLRVDPFALDLGQLALWTDGWRLDARGAAVATDGGLRRMLEARIDAIPARSLIALWPRGLAPGTRAWLDRNVRAGTLRDLRLALRADPGAEPAATLAYDFDGADVTVVPGLPPVEGGSGRAMLQAGAFALTLDRGRIVPPAGGPVDLAGSTFRVAEVTRVPGVADVAVTGRGSITAVLSLIDQPPFRFLSAASLAPDIAGGDAAVAARLSLPLIARVKPGDVTWSASARLSGVSSDRLVPGRRLAAPVLSAAADPTEVAVAGEATLDGVPVAGGWRQPLGPPGVPLPPARVAGRIALGPAFAAAFLPGLPQGTVAGAGWADVVLDLPRGAPARLSLTSDLAGVALRIAAARWDKPAGQRGRLAVEARLGGGVAIDRVELVAPGLSAIGSAAVRADGALERMRLDRLRVGDWLDTGLTRDGSGAVALTGGTLDLRRIPGGAAGAAAAPAAGAGGAPLALALDRVEIADGLALTGVAGRVETRAGLTGRIDGRLNGQAAVAVRIEATPAGPAFRITAADAGAALASAGLFDRMRGGTLDLVLTPRGPGFDGHVAIAGFRLAGMPVLAEILNAVSIVGLIDQLSAGGLAFSRASAALRLDGARLAIRDGVAEGPGFGVTLSGSYDTAARRIEMDGVISPVYILNGIGQLLTRPGEGMFGFTYRISGPAGRPAVSVNPLSVLVPGPLRNAFRAQPAEGAAQRAAPADLPQGGDR